MQLQKQRPPELEGLVSARQLVNTGSRFLRLLRGRVIVTRLGVMMPPLRRQFSKSCAQT